ncbi:hypothetical protein G6F63_016429 [Rhizopus arrhizus]|nr:hypothetical protein G6F63_016429 [Rhizopus arrhizus]
MRRRLPSHQQQRHRQEHQALPEQGMGRAGSAGGVNRAPRRTDNTGKLQHQCLLFCVTAVCSRTQSR